VGSGYVAQADLELTSLLSSWDYKCAPLYLACWGRSECDVQPCLNFIHNWIELANVLFRVLAIIVTSYMELFSSLFYLWVS
jgi:hypothetical protein